MELEVCSRPQHQQRDKSLTKGFYFDTKNVSVTVKASQEPAAIKSQKDSQP